MSDWTVLCDFDGTICVDDITDTLLERYGQPGWEALESDWRAGRIGSRECMAGQIALLDMSRAQLDAHLTERRIDPAFVEFVAAAHALGLPLEIVSDGLDYAIHFILTRHGLDGLPVVANHLQSSGDRAWRLTSPHAKALCHSASGTCKCARAQRAARTRQRVLMIGDGASDFCVAAAADFVFAKGKLAAHCRTRSIAHVRIESFAEAVNWLPALVAGDLTAHEDEATPAWALQSA